MSEEMTITVIPKKCVLPAIKEDGTKAKTRVAAYARVSTDFEEQKNSFEAQLEEYQTRIANNPDWEFVRLYSDEGITGTNTKHRDDFKQMIKDALDGKIDLILIKSISRFARNTVDCLATVRALRKKHVYIFFDKENISTEDPKSDSMLTIYASFAEEESKSTSQNVTWGVRKRMAKGQRKMNVATTIGYKADENGKVYVDETTKDIIVQIFNIYAAGYTCRQIASLLMSQGIKTGTGKSQWTAVDVSKILSNEKYIGQFIMQKTVTIDVLEHKVVKNDGIVEKFIADNHHEAIIDKDKFNEIQAIKKHRFERNDNNNPDINLLNGLFFCESCLRKMKLITVHPNSKYAKRVFTCKTTVKSSPNYRNCDCLNTIDHLLVNKAIGAILSKFYDAAKSIDNTVIETYDAAVKDILMKIDEYKNLIKEAEIKMATLIKLQLEEKDITKYQIEFNNIKSNVDFYKSQINKLETSIGEENKKYIIQKKVEDYLSKGNISYEIIKTFIRGAVRRKDNSIRFIIGDESIEINESTIVGLLNVKPIFTSTAVNDKTTLQFDVIRIGGNKNV